MRRLAIGLALVMGAGACITPSIPIPPPEPAAMTFTVNVADGLATFAYRATDRYASAIVYVFNEDLGDGIITTARPDGSVGPTRPFPAMAGNRVIVTFEIDDQSVSECVRIRDGTPTANDRCD